MTMQPHSCIACGETGDLRILVDVWGLLEGICEECYKEIPEPDTGMPDFEDLPPLK